ncbi:MAG: TlyA family RNA methyltransferase [bacterium]|nr:TlyA family RNA methyltransferase [bacterium]
MKRVRIDKLIVDLGLAASRERARALIMAGNVLVNETPVTKAGTMVDPGADIRMRGEDNPFVSRGGIKLTGALDYLAIDVKGKTILDVGASTGGFTDVCLQRGAVMSYAVDVGTNQLAYNLRTDPRVLSLEQTNARNLTPDMFPGPADIAVIDVSFISITRLLAAVVSCLKPGGEILAMVKPQFEVGKENIGKGGVVRDDEQRGKAVERVAACAGELGFIEKERVDSQIKGPKGNLEIFVHFVRAG